jgi:hypothetical protein
MKPFIHPQVRAVGILWFRQEDYPALRAIMEDADQMHDTWEEWRKAAEESERHVKAQGHLTERIYIDPETFPDWCADHRLGLNQEARQRFAGSMIAQKHRNQS